MESCCALRVDTRPTPSHCPECGRPGRDVERITLKALHCPEPLMRLSAPKHRFCSTPECPVVYFGHGEVFGRGDLTVPVFQKEPAGARTVCYCFAITEREIQQELAVNGRSTASDRVTQLVKASRCACEVRNPQGSCCLGNLATVTRG